MAARLVIVMRNGVVEGVFASEPDMQVRIFEHDNDHDEETAEALTAKIERFTKELQEVY
jgi:hypothetical protein